MKRIVIIIILLYLVCKKETKLVKIEQPKQKIVWGHNMINAIEMGAMLSKADAG
jgi:hypothetical protein